MSAFILSDKHFSAVAQYIGLLNPKLNPCQLADKLKSINIDSVNYRYNEKTRKTKCSFQPQAAGSILSRADIIKLIDCWHYQSCEDVTNIDYHTMKAFLYSHFNQEQIKLAQYESDKWSID